MARRDQEIAVDGTEISYKEWPDNGSGGIDPSGVVDDNGTTRPLNTLEIAGAAEVNDELDRVADAFALKDDLQNAKDVRDEAAQSRTDMDPAGPPLPKWEPLTGAGNQSNRIAALEALVNDLLVEQRRQYGDTRTIGAMLVRKFRKDRDDE